MTTVLVTGAGGFVGSAVVRLLVRSLQYDRPTFSDGTPVGHVTALLRPGGSLERLQELDDFGNWSVEYADIGNRAALREVLARVGPRAILHLAVDPAIFSDLSEEEERRLNIAPLETMFESLIGVPGGRLIHTSSVWVLPAGERLDEDVKPEPRSAYAESKASADRSLPALHERTGVDWINLRLFNIFGKYEGPSRLLPYLVARLTKGETAELSSGDQIRDFNDVEDIARAYVLALRASENACGKVYHIGSGRATSVRAFARTVARFTGNAELIRFGVVETQDQFSPCQVADATRARRLLNWSAASDLEARIGSTVNWWMERLEAATTA